MKFVDLVPGNVYIVEQQMVFEYNGRFCAVEPKTVFLFISFVPAPTNDTIKGEMLADKLFTLTLSQGNVSAFEFTEIK